MNLIKDAFRKFEEVINTFDERSKKTAKIMKSV